MQPGEAGEKLAHERSHDSCVLLLLIVSAHPQDVCHAAWEGANHALPTSSASMSDGLHTVRCMLVCRILCIIW